jgi:hypothetical protein
LRAFAVAERAEGSDRGTVLTDWLAPGRRID